MNVFKKAALTTLLILLVWVGGFFAFIGMTLSSSPKGIDETTDAIVVLTGGKNRIQEGLQLFANGRATHLFISGVFKDVTRSEILSLWTGEHALPPCCVTLGYNATSTAQNAQETREWLEEQDYSSIRLVTGNYHMPRSLMELSHALPGIDIYPHPVKQPDLSVKSEWYWRLMFMEYHKYLYRWIQLLFTPQHPFEEAE